MIGTTLGHYRIVRQLGTGGMGEVYVAEDTTLGRQVALKVLPSTMAGDPERRQRFEREAKAVAALNHPNIITIHSVESAGDVLFLTMELVDGKTLDDLIPPHGLPIDHILKLAIPLTDAVSAAHQRGITHRDLKPTNIMVTADGRLKVLDFGLAKLAEETVDGSPGTVLPTELVTGEGRIVGTVAYMSPEQAEGKPVDPRSDIFSLGIILYEMATGERPFKGDTSVSIISSIIKDTPVPVSERNAALPRDFARIVKRSLVKDAEHRYQTAKDLRNDLEALKEDEESGAIAAKVTPSSVDMPAPVPRGAAPRVLTAAIAIGVIAVVAAAGFAWYRLRPVAVSEPTAQRFDAVKLTRLTTTGKATLAAISPDGKYVVHVVDDAGQSLWMRQTATTSNVQIVPPAAVRYDGLAFAPDGNYVYYSTYPAARGGGSNIATLYQVPVLGGTPRRILEDIDSPVSFSPDGKRFAYLRGFQTAGETVVMLANVDGSGVTKFVTRKAPENFPLTSVAWSPDGKTIAVPILRSTAGQRSMGVLAIDATSGKDTFIGTKQWDQIGAVAWLGNTGLAIAGTEPATASTQLWYLSYPSGEARHITNDLNNYDQISVSGDASALVTVQGDAVSHLWIASVPDAATASQISRGTSRFDTNPAWTPDGKLVYVSNANNNSDIWICDADGRNAKQLTVDPGFDNSPVVSPDGKFIVFQSSRNGNQIWRMDLDGGNQTALTSGTGSALPIVSPDSQWVFYITFGEAQRGIWKIPIAGGEPIRVIAAPPPDADPAVVTARVTFVPRTISPDGRLLAGSFLDREARGFRVGIFAIDTGELMKSFDHLFYMLAWTRDGRAVTYADVKDGVWNLWNQPIDGGPPKPMTNFTSDQIFSFGWSIDGKRLAIARGTVTNDVVLVSNLPRNR
jgi:eukaryotic-like serine/threonine-protein kinase